MTTRLPVLTGVRIEIAGEKLTLASTDRYRLAVRELVWRPEDPEVTGTALIPARTLADAAKALAAAGAETSVAIGSGPSGEALAGFTCGARHSTTRLIDGQFPDYRRLLPPTSPLSAEVEVSPLVDAARRVSLVAARTAPIMLTFSAGEVVLEAGAGGEAQAREALAASYDGPDPVDRVQPGLPARRPGRAGLRLGPCRVRHGRPGGSAAQAGRFHRQVRRFRPGLPLPADAGAPVRLSGPPSRIPRERTVLEPASDRNRIQGAPVATIGIIGLGRMGGNMAKRIKQAGHTVVGYDRDPGRARRRLAAGAGRRRCRRRASCGSWFRPAAPTQQTINELKGLLAPAT